ncbi:MAG TPA: hypothetical protein VIH76_17800 [Candidatus Acidoferrales bacterium]
MRLTAFTAALLVVLLFVGVVPAAGQGIKRILISRGRVFSEFGPGLAEMKRDAAGNYYVLATPASVIWIVGPHGQRLGQIPKANLANSGSAGAPIQYAVDFDIDPNGRILVADRGANAIEIFQPDGTFVTKVQVFAPTSVVALSDDEFAVSTLRTKRLVLVMNDTGKQIRSFGDPADAGVDVSATPLASLGRISGDSQGQIYFAFTTIANPTIRKFDRFGYSHGDASVSNDQLAYKPPEREDRVQFGFNISQLNFSSMLDGGAMIGTSGDIQLSGGVGSGLGGRIGGGGGPATSAGLLETLLSSGLGGPTGAGTGRGSGAGRGAGIVTGQAFIQGDNVRLNLGPGSGARGSGGNDDDSDDSSAFKLRFRAQDALDTKISGDTEWLDAAMQDFQTAQAIDQGSGLGLGGDAGGSGTNGLGQGVLVGLGGIGGGLAGGGVGGTHSFDRGVGSGGGGGRPGGGGGFGGFGGYGPHGRFGDVTNFTATIKVNLDPQFLTADDKPTVTAVGVDPQTKDIWASIGKALMHFDANGTLLDSYLIATPDGAPLRAKAIVVEPDRLIIASDPRGIFEFERPDGAGPVGPARQP